MKNQNPVWNFFASVKLALFTLCCLAVTSIVGTIIPQNESIQFYVKNYGPKTAQFFQIFSIPDMYSSWWFLSLLALLSANLIVCSIERFPVAWKLIRQDNLNLPIERIAKMGLSEQFTTALSPSAGADKLGLSLNQYGWKSSTRTEGESHLLFSQKTPYSRAGVYFVHLSILIIFAGAIYGNFTGFKASIMLPELQSSQIVYPFQNGSPIDLGFELRCDRFDIEFYSNGMPKEYRSKLVVLENGQEIQSKDIEVNKPLTYKGVTFYQSSYQGFRDFIFSVRPGQREASTFKGSFQKEIFWKEEGITFGIINLESTGDRVTKLKIWFKDDEGEASTFWMNAAEQVKINRPSKSYMFSAKQRYATGLQVAKDPGVWVVYIGCGLMLLGLYMAFFMSHRRIWAIISAENGVTTITLRGSANKNKAGFEKTFRELSDNIKQEFSVA